MSIEACVMDYNSNREIGDRATRRLIDASEEEHSGTGVVGAVRREDGVWDLASFDDPDAVSVWIEPAQGT